MAASAKGGEKSYPRVCPLGVIPGRSVRTGPGISRFRVRCFASPRNDDGARLKLPAARLRPSCASRPPSKIERAQGMPGEGLTHGPRAMKKHGEGTTGSAGSSGIPRAVVLRLIARSPRRPGFLAPVIGERSSANLASASGGQDHTPLPSASALFVRTNDRASPKRPSHPAANVRDDREAPLRRRRTGQAIHDFRFS